MDGNKATIETIINTAAIALASAGTFTLIDKDIWGLLFLLVAMGLEFFKYWGRDKYYW